MASGSPAGLIAPIIALQIYVDRRATLPLQGVWVFGLLVCIIVGFFGAGAFVLGRKALGLD